MIHVLPWKRRKHKQIEAEKNARLEAAQRELDDLKTRGENAATILQSRRGRNHWQESIAQMIQGV